MTIPQKFLVTIPCQSGRHPFGHLAKAYVWWGDGVLNPPTKIIVHLCRPGRRRKLKEVSGFLWGDITDVAAKLLKEEEKHVQVASKA
jgi:hypothetical protein